MQRVSKCLLASLRQHGILPADQVRACLSATGSVAGDLLPLFIALWQSALTRTKRAGPKRRICRLLTWLERERQHGAALTLSVPQAQQRVRQWIGERLVWWPRGVPTGRRVAIVSSRLGRLEKLDRDWFAALREVCCELDVTSQVLVSAQGTALGELLERCSELHALPWLQFELARGGMSPIRWLAECTTRDGALLRTANVRWPAIVSPPLQVTDDGEQIPARDAIVIAASDRVIACRVRRGGHISRLLGRRLTEAARRSSSSVVVLSGEGFVAPDVASVFAAQGATVREMANRTVRVTPVNEIRSPDPSPGRAEIRAVDNLPLANYLSHCTRAANGPWPDQNRADYLDSLLLGRADAPHSALATLVRIVRQRRLLATGRAIRGGTPVVCFTAVELAKLPELHTFRAHRGRWDFEPYGISISQQWLFQREALPVTYGDETLWTRLAETERPFFQRRWSGADNVIDWSREREWRHVGTLDFSDLPGDAAFLFVRTRKEAAQLSILSRWPVVVVPQTLHSGLQGTVCG
ncbi:MAG: hypothetical protein ACYC6N_27015 [Pirellulaceae bacterium]